MSIIPLLKVTTVLNFMGWIVTDTIISEPTTATMIMAIVRVRISVDAFVGRTTHRHRSTAMTLVRQPDV